MKITTETHSKMKPTAHSVIFTLNDLEAGYLRRLLKPYGINSCGFAADLFRELDKYWFPTYEKEYPNWREERD